MPKKKEVEYLVNANGCHICTSHAPNGDGYPYANFNGELWRLSRWVYTQNNGKIPENLVIRHTCDDRLCINPKHLEIGTKAENNKDRAERKRNRNQNGENNNMSKLTDKQVLEIRASNLSGSKIGTIYNISASLANMIKSKKRWKNL